VVGGGPEETITIPAERNPAFRSLNRGHLFYGRVESPAQIDELYLQAERNPDITCRYRAFLRIVDREKIAPLSDPSRIPDPRCAGLIFRELFDEILMMKAGGQFLALFDSVQDRAYAHRYQEL